MISQGRNSVNVKRTDLLEKLMENRKIHKKDFEEALIGYKLKLIGDLSRMYTLVQETKPEAMHTLRAVSFDCPRSYEAEYNEIIDMMIVSVDEVINLDSQSFKQYFKNEWAWSSHFNASATMYKNAAFGAS